MSNSAITGKHKSRSRRQFLKHIAATGIVAAAGKPLPSLAAVAKERAAAESGRAPVKNGKALTPNAFYLLPLGSIQPAGWLRRQLEIQRDGLGGHLDETWADVGPNSGWLGGTGESWERGPYFLDGLVPLAYSLGDKTLKAKAQRYIDWTLSSGTLEGSFGPKSNNDWWPRMVMLKALTQYYEVSGDPRVLALMKNYFRYQLATLPGRPLRDWGKYRWHENALSVLWLYNRNGDASLLDLVRLLHAQGFDWQSEFADFQFTKKIRPEAVGLKDGNNPDAALQTHGVNNGEAIKASPIWSQVTGREQDRQAIYKQLHALDTYHGLPNGMFSCDEHFAGRNPSQGSELCTVVESMFSLEHSLAILGDPALGDRLERLAYNALPGAFTDDMWAHQYNQEPNQVEVSLHRQPWTTDGPESNLYGLEPNFGCCTANFHQGWPKFAASLFMLSADDGLVATAYAPCSVDTVVRNTAVRIISETEYPFRSTIRFTIQPASPVAFPLRLRIPAWAEGAALSINGAKHSSPATGSFARIERTWTAGDVVTLELPMKPAVSRWFQDSAAVERGPLVFSYSIGEDWVKLRDRGMTADWQVYPATPWNYALAIDPATAAATIQVTEAPVGDGPFTRANAPVKLSVRARKLPAWQAEDGVAAAVPASPVKSDQPEEMLTLIPYAAAKLRITAFPLLANEV